MLPLREEGNPLGWCLMRFNRKPQIPSMCWIIVCPVLELNRAIMFGVFVDKDQHGSWSRCRLTVMNETASGVSWCSRGWKSELCIRKYPPPPAIRKIPLLPPRAPKVVLGMLLSLSQPQLTICNMGIIILAYLTGLFCGWQQDNIGELFWTLKVLCRC